MLEPRKVSGSHVLVGQVLSEGSFGAAELSQQDLDNFVNFYPDKEDRYVSSEVGLNILNMVLDEKPPEH